MQFTGNVNLTDLSIRLFLHSGLLKFSHFPLGFETAHSGNTMFPRGSSTTSERVVKVGLPWIQEIVRQEVIFICASEVLLERKSQLFNSRKLQVKLSCLSIKLLKVHTSLIFF